jgi:hypothetical protein
MVTRIVYWVERPVHAVASWKYEPAMMEEEIFKCDDGRTTAWEVLQKNRTSSEDPCAEAEELDHAPLKRIERKGQEAKQSTE